jgi:DNA segregation ATPase FtsK/SpoIIIE-like protein
MHDNPQQLHNFIASGHMNDVLASTFPSFAANTTGLSTRSIWLPALAEPVWEWPSVLFQHNVAFNWLFLNASDLRSQRARQLIALAQDIAPIMTFCYRRERDMEADELAALLEARSKKGGRGMILSCYTESTFGALQVFRAFLPKVVDETNSPTWSPEAACVHDPCYGLARELILSSGTVSLSLVQRTLKLSYTHASKLISAMVGDILDRDLQDGRLSLRRTA